MRTPSDSESESESDSVCFKSKGEPYLDAVLISTSNTMPNKICEELVLISTRNTMPITYVYW